VATRPATRPQPQSNVDELTETLMRFLKGLWHFGVYSLFVWLGYDLFAPLFHLPLANPLHAAGLLLAGQTLVGWLKR
jgi:hypothetical protein